MPVTDRKERTRSGRFASAWFVSVVCVSFLLIPTGADGQGRSGHTNPYGVWEPFIGDLPSTLAIPDLYANYFAFAFDRTASDQAARIGLRIRGEFGYARYMSYNIYDADQASSNAALTDIEILPSPGSVNPFLPGVDPQAEDREYVVVVQPDGYPVDPGENLLSYDPDTIQKLTVILRYYVLEDATAGVPLPEIEAFDVETGDSVPLPERYLVGTIPKKVFTARLSPIFRTDIDNTMRFYRARGVGQFENADNLYVVSAVNRRAHEVLVFRFMPPSVPSSNSEYPVKDTRYWSINLGNADSTTAVGMMDAQFRIASDGFVYVAVGGVSMRREIEERGYNFMPWSMKGHTAIILYRNLVTNPLFAGRISLVPFIDLSNPQNIFIQDAKNYIGGYAPTGRKVTHREFLENGGGIVPPSP